jgi:rhamnosyltransferase
MNISAKKFSIIIVVYNVRLEDSLTFLSLNKSIHSLGGEKCNLIIYDNSPSKQTIEESKFPNWNITYIHDDTNPGVSKAYNVSVDIAAKNDVEWVLLADQDTDFPEDALDKYFKSVNENGDVNLHVPMLLSDNKIYSPCRVVFSRGTFWNGITPGLHSLKGRTVLNSGILINVAAFLKCGGYNPQIELYFSDFDFIERYKKIYPTFFVIDMLCNHQLSDIVKVDLEAAKRRFNYYCKGSYHSRMSSYHFFQLFVTIFLRSVKLNFKYKTIVFSKIFFKYYV